MRIFSGKMGKTNLKGLPLQQLEAFVASIGEPKYRAKQLFAWLYKHRVPSFDAMTTLSHSLRERLKEEAAVEQLASPTGRVRRPTGQQNSSLRFQTG